VAKSLQITEKLVMIASTKIFKWIDQTYIFLLKNAEKWACASCAANLLQNITVGHVTKSIENLFKMTDSIVAFALYVVKGSLSKIRKDALFASTKQKDGIHRQDFAFDL